MNLKGKQTYHTTAQQIWDILMDTDKLTKITPGVSKLERIEADQFNAISEIKIGPVKGAFKGDLFLEDKNEPHSFTLRVKQLSKIGNADATVNILINELEEGACELAFDGKAKLSGTLARTGQRVLSGVANALTKQFFKALEEEVNNSGATPQAQASTPAEATNVTPNPKAAANLVAPKAPKTETPKAAAPQPESFSFFNWLKSLFSS